MRSARLPVSSAMSLDRTVPGDGVLDQGSNDDREDPAEVAVGL